MNYRILGLLSFIVLPGVFIYLIGAFLMSTFDINLWYDGQRFTAVVAYLYILSLIPKVFGDSDKKTEKRQTIEKVEVKQEEAIEA